MHEYADEAEIIVMYIHQKVLLFFCSSGRQEFYQYINNYKKFNIDAYFVRFTDLLFNFLKRSGSNRPHQFL